MSEYKIGQQIVTEKDMEVKGFFDNENPILVKSGARGFLNSRGMIHWQTGGVRGKVQMLNDAEMKGYDNRNIAKLIFNSLDGYFNISEILEDNDIDILEFRDNIEYALEDIL